MKTKEVKLEGWIKELDEYLQTYEGNKEDFCNGVRWCAGRDDNPIVKHALDMMLRMEEKAMEEQEDFTIAWLKKNIDLEDKQFEEWFVEVSIEDKTTDEKDAGHIVIAVGGDMYWSLMKGTAGKEWLCTLWDEPDTDSWIPSVKTIGDFKRLFRVATGFELPIKR